MWTYVCGFGKIAERFSNVWKIESNNQGWIFCHGIYQTGIGFPKLLRLAQHHLKKLEKAEYSLYYEKMLEEIHSKMKNEYPGRLLLKEQGMFMVGYYQQMQDLYQKKNKENEKGEN